MAKRTADVVRSRDREDLRLFYTAFLLSPDIILIHEKDGRMMESNPAAQESMGYTAEELEEMNVRDFVLVNPEDWANRVGSLDDGGELRFRTSHRRKDGSTFDVDVVTRQVEVGGRTVVVGVGRDVSDQRLAEMMNKSLDNISAAISSSLDHDGMVTSVMSNARKAMGVNAAVIYMPADGAWRPRYSDGAGEVGSGTRFGDDAGIVEAVREKGSAVVINDALEDPRIDREAAARHNIRSLVVAPLRTRGQLVGLLSFECHRRASFSDAHVNFVNKLSNTISLVLENVHLSQEEREAESALLRRTRQLEVLSRVGVEINSELRTSMVLRKLVRAAMDLTDATSGVYGKCAGGEIVYSEYREGDRILPAGFSFPPGHGVPGWVLENRRPYLTNDAAADPQAIPAVREKLGIRNLINVPVIGRSGEILGCLGIHNKARGQDFNEEDVMILQGLAASAAVAVDNARTMEQRDSFEKDLQRQKRDYQTVFDAVPALIAIKDTDSNIVAANPAFLRSFGLRPEDPAGWRTHATPELRERYRLDDLEVIRSKEPKYGIVEEGRDPRGVPVWLRTDKLPYMDSAGNVIGVILFSQDITESKRTQEELLREKDFMSTVMETTPAGIVVIYRNGRIVFANRVAERILGLRTSGLLQRSYDDPRWGIEDYSGGPFPPEDLPFRRVMATGQPVYGIRHAIVRPDGERALLLLNAAPLNEEGDPSGVIVSIEDVTAVVRAQEALQESLKTSGDIVRQMPSGILIFRYEEPDRIFLVSANPAAEILVGGLEGTREQEYGRIWENDDFLATKDEILEVARTGNTLWKENVHYSGGPAEGAFDLRAFSLPSNRICLNFDDVTQSLVEADLRRKAYSQIEQNIEHFATLVDRIRNPLSAIIAQAEALDPAAAQDILRRTEDIESIIKELDQGWIRSEKVRSFLKKNI